MRRFQFVVGFIFLFTACGGRPAENISQAPASEVSAQPKTQATSAGRESARRPNSDDKAYQFLAEQRAKSEGITSRAAELINDDRMADVRKLYQDRWKELTRLRVHVSQDNALSADEKKNVDRALEADQEGITAILDKYDSLFGR